MSKTLNLEYVNCNLCGRDDAQLIFKASSIRRGQSDEFNVVQCRDCGLVYTNPRISPEKIKDYYPKDHEYHEARSISFFENLYYSFFRKIPGIKNGKILDVGCGNGSYLNFLKKRGWDCYGTELNDSMVHYMITNLGLNITKGELCNVSFPDEYFDAVTFWGSLEHMSDALSVLKTARRLLKTNGKIIVWTQNIASLEAKIFKNYWHHLEVPTHYYQFSPATLVKLLKRAGFKITKVRFDSLSMGIIPSLYYVLNKIGLKININRLIIKVIFIPLDMLLALFRMSGLFTIYAAK